jgi:hypothetical protein
MPSSTSRFTSAAEMRRNAPILVDLIMPCAQAHLTMPIETPSALAAERLWRQAGRRLAQSLRH